MTTSKKGFTLLELLVVIAIIGLMATIVLVNVRGQRAKARDASIQSSMHQLRNAAEMSYDRNNESYDLVCGDDNTLSNSGELKALEAAIKRDNGNKDVACYESSDKKDFAASSPLVAREGKHWCIESAGLSREIDEAITSAKCE